MPALHPELVSRAILKAKGKHVPEFYGLSQAAYHELADLANHCEKELGLDVGDAQALGKDAGMSLGFRGKRNTYQVRVTPRDGVFLDSGPFGGTMQQVFRRQASFNHLLSGEVFRLIQGQEKIYGNR